MSQVKIQVSSTETFWWSPTAHPDLEPSRRSKVRLSCPPLDPLTHPLFSQSKLNDSQICLISHTSLKGSRFLSAEKNHALRTPHRTLESAEDTAGDGKGFSPAVPQQTATFQPRPSQSTHPSPKVGSSFEWDGTSQAKNFFDVVKNRSKVASRLTGNNPNQKTQASAVCFDIAFYPSQLPRVFELKASNQVCSSNFISYPIIISETPDILAKVLTFTPAGK